MWQRHKLFGRPQDHIGPLFRDTAVDLDAPANGPQVVPRVEGLFGLDQRGLKNGSMRSVGLAICAPRWRRRLDRAVDGEFHPVQLLLAPLLVQLVALLELGHDLFANSSSDSMMCSCLRSPHCGKKFKMSRCASSYWRRFSRTYVRRADEQAAPAHAVQRPRALVLRLQVRGCLTRLRLSPPHRRVF